MDGYGKRVLVVDDDEAVRSLICSILSDAGYNVYEAVDGLNAMDLLKKRRYDALLTDYHMPNMDGLELLTFTKEMWPDLPVIVATSDVVVSGPTAHQLLQPAYAILEKPFDRSDLLNRIRSAVHGLPSHAPDARVLRQNADVSRQQHAAFQAFA
jgi:CheY-like chemotaxis protein